MASGGLCTPTPPGGVLGMARAPKALCTPPHPLHGASKGASGSSWSPRSWWVHLTARQPPGGLCPPCRPQVPPQGAGWAHVSAETMSSRCHPQPVAELLHRCLRALPEPASPQVWRRSPHPGSSFPQTWVPAGLEGPAATIQALAQASAGAQAWGWVPCPRGLWWKTVDSARGLLQTPSSAFCQHLSQEADALPGQPWRLRGLLPIQAASTRPHSQVPETRGGA